PLSPARRAPHSFPTRRSSDLNIGAAARAMKNMGLSRLVLVNPKPKAWPAREALSMAASALDVLDRVRVVATLEDAIAECHLVLRSEEHTSELQSRENLVCRLL